LAISHINGVIASLVLKFPNFRYHGNKGRSQKIPISAPYVEVMFQIWWWRSVHKWRHSLVYSRRTPDIGDRTRQVILYAVKCCYAVYWTDNNPVKFHDDPICNVRVAPQEQEKDDDAE